MKPAAIKAKRKSLGMSQQEFANELGVSFATVNRWENGKSQPQPDRLQNITALAVKSAQRKGKDLTTLIDEWTGRLVLAIGRGEFRDEVSMLIQTTMQEAYDRGKNEGSRGRLSDDYVELANHHNQHCTCNHIY